MSPVANKANLHVDPKRTNDDETDEGFVSVSPSVQRIGVGLNRKTNSESSDNNSDTASDNGSQTETSSSSSSSGSQGLGSLHSDDERPTSNNKSSDAEESSSNNKPNTSKDAVESKAESLAKFIVYTLLGKISGNTNDKVERTLLRCVKLILEKHEINFKGMVNRCMPDIGNRETGYSAFVTVANSLFEDEKRIITWSRIVGLYAFGTQLALYFKDKNMEDLSAHLWIGKYTKENLTTHITSIGGWGKLCEEFPEDSDIENTIKRVLSWTGVGLAVAATLLHLTSR